MLVVYSVHCNISICGYKVSCSGSPPHHSTSCPHLKWLWQSSLFCFFYKYIKYINHIHLLHLLHSASPNFHCLPPNRTCFTFLSFTSPPSPTCTGAQTQGLHREPLYNPFVLGIFKIESHGTVCPGWLRTGMLLISASWVARITGMSHWPPACPSFLMYIFVVQRGFAIVFHLWIYHTAVTLLYPSPLHTYHSKAISAFCYGHLPTQILFDTDQFIFI
jgi:hypothetical protein